MRHFPLSLLLLQAAFSLASLHHLFVSTFSGSSLYGLEFDDEALTLEIKQNNTAESSYFWIAFDHAKRNVYAAGDGNYGSYSVANDSTLNFETSVEMSANCTNTRAVYVLSSPQPPYSVYGVPFGDCGTVISVNANGSLSTAIQNYSYATTSGVHGLALSSDNRFLYSADDSGNALWTHSIDNTTGKVTLVDKLSGPVSGADPRHAAIHTSGKYLYVVLEGTNELAVYSLDEQSGVPTYTNITYPLIPLDQASSDYWSDEVKLSSSGSYLWASSRARSTNSTGYISAFSLAPSGSIIRQLFLEETSSSGGSANAVAPAFFSDRWVALTDSSEGFIEIWTLAVNGTPTAEVVARLDIEDGGCCANAIWYD